MHGIWRTCGGHVKDMCMFDVGTLCDGHVKDLNEETKTCEVHTEDGLWTSIGYARNKLSDKFSYFLHVCSTVFFL